MKKIFFATLVMALLTHSSYSQFGGLLNKAKNKVNQRVDKKVDSEMEKGLDKAEGKKTPAPEEKPEEVTTAKSGSTETAAAPADNSLKSFSRFDFVPGEQIIYFDNFEQETIAELPLGWNTNGTGEVVTLEKLEGQWLRLHQPFIYLTRNDKDFTDSYTIEFDIIMQLKSNGWMYPEVKFGFFASKGEPTTNNNFLTEYRKNAAMLVTISPGEYQSTRARLNSFNENKDYFHSEAKPFPALEKSWGKPVHVSVMVQKERFRMWINEEKLFDVPKGIPVGNIMNQLLFQIGNTNYKDDQYGMYINNIKVATGKPDARHRLVEEGKFSTTGILFNVNSASIKPESYGVLKEVAEVMKKNEGIKVKIIGHTDSDGTDVANLELSKKRAAAVRTALTEEFGIDEARMVTDGKGESVPVGDNKTKEGKGQNRRVEFIKQ
jgi:outer membrane protein OmpA-like peptidoglycan-associated protein